MRASFAELFHPDDFLPYISLSYARVAVKDVLRREGLGEGVRDDHAGDDCVEAVGGGSQEDGGIILAEGLSRREKVNHRRQMTRVDEARLRLRVEEGVHATRAAEDAAHADHMLRAQRTHLGGTVQYCCDRRTNRRALVTTREQSRNMRLRHGK